MRPKCPGSRLETVEDVAQDRWPWVALLGDGAQRLAEPSIQVRILPGLGQALSRRFLAIMEELTYRPLRHRLSSDVPLTVRVGVATRSIVAGARLVLRRVGHGRGVPYVELELWGGSASTSLPHAALFPIGPQRRRPRHLAERIDQVLPTPRRSRLR